MSSPTTLARHIETLASVFRRRSSIEHAEALARFRSIEVAAQVAMAQTAQQMRSQGASWTAVGDALGVSKQAAQQRFGPGRAPHGSQNDPQQLTID